MCFLQTVLLYWGSNQPVKILRIILYVISTESRGSLNSYLLPIFWINFSFILFPITTCPEPSVTIANSARLFWHEFPLCTSLQIYGHCRIGTKSRCEGRGGSKLKMKEQRIPLLQTFSSTKIHLCLYEWVKLDSASLGA